MYSNSDNGVKGKPKGTFTLKDEKEPDVIKKLWGVGEVGVPGNQVEGIWYGKVQGSPNNDQVIDEVEVVGKPWTCTECTVRNDKVDAPVCYLCETARP